MKLELQIPSEQYKGTDWRDILETEGAYSPKYVGEGFGEYAKLFVAAPELLQVLKEIQDFWAGGDCPKELEAKMCAAIAKADGK